jgi:hypothetical protein
MIVLRSLMPLRLMCRVLGIGVAVSVSTSTPVVSAFSLSFWLTPNFCSSSTTSRPVQCTRVHCVCACSFSC